MMSKLPYIMMVPFLDGRCTSISICDTPQTTVRYSDCGFWCPTTSTSPQLEMCQGNGRLPDR